MRSAVQGRRWHILGVVGLLLMTSGAPAAQAASGDVVWPPSDKVASRDVDELALGVLKSSDPVVVGVDAVLSVDAERVNTGTVRLTVHEEAGLSQTFRLSHVTPTPEGYAEADLVFGPEHLDRPLVEVTPGTGIPSGAVVAIIAPPGSFDVSGQNRQEKGVSFAERIGYPTEGLEVAPGVLAPHMFNGHPACFERLNGTCSQEAQVDFRCEDCRGWLRVLEPSPATEVTQAYGRYPVVESTLNRIHLWFDAEDRLVAALVFMALDLDPAALMDPSRAEDRVVAFLEERGFIPKDPYDVAQLVHPFETDRAVPRAHEYRWHPGFKDPSLAPSNQDRIADIVQDAETGDVVDARFRPGAVAEGDQGSESLPGPGFGVVAAAALLVAWMGRRRRDGRSES